jgi:cytochrome c-type biogenesis protein CcmH
MTRTLALVALLVALSPPARAGDADDVAISVPFATTLVGAPAGHPLTGAELAARTETLSRQLRCPVCQGSSVGDSPSSTARNMKQQVRDLLAAGFSEEQAITYFVASYGDFVRLAPKPEGFNAVVWVAPVLLFVLGALAVAFYLRRRPRPAIAPPPAPAADDPELAPYLREVRALVDGPARPPGDS